MKICIPICITAILLSLLTTFRVNAQTFLDVEYVEGGHPKQKMDIYVPAGTDSFRPAVMFIHGGGWHGGKKGKVMRHLGVLFEREKFVIADINYRLSGDSVFPAQIFDCKAAVRYLKANAAQYHIDTCRIGVMGTSAGAHLAALLGLSNGIPALEGLHLGNRGVSSRIYALVDAFGPSDLLTFDSIFPDSCKRRNTQNKPGSASDQLLGCLPKDCPDKARLASPIYYVDSMDVPVQIHHGDNDCVVPPLQSKLLFEALRKAGVSSELFIYEGKGHGGFDEREFRSRLEPFFIKYLAGPESPCEQTTSTEGPPLPSEAIELSIIDGKMWIRSASDFGDMKWFITGLTGRLAIAGITKDNTVTLDITGLARGCYVLYVSRGSASVHRLFYRN